MEWTKKLFFVSGSILMLAVAFHLGATTASSQSSQEYPSSAPYIPSELEWLELGLQVFNGDDDMSDGITYNFYGDPETGQIQCNIYYYGSATTEDMETAERIIKFAEKFQKDRHPWLDIQFTKLQLDK